MAAGNQVLRQYPLFLHLKSVHPNEVKHPSVPVRAGVQKRRAACKMPHGPVHRAIHFITAGTDGRADSDKDILLSGAKFPDKGINNLPGNIQGSAFPARMYRSDNMPPYVNQENWHTIRCLDYKGHTRPVGQQGIELPIHFSRK